MKLDEYFFLSNKPRYEWYSLSAHSYLIPTQLLAKMAQRGALTRRHHREDEAAAAPAEEDDTDKYVHLFSYAASLFGSVKLRK